MQFVRLEKESHVSQFAKCEMLDPRVTLVGTFHTCVPHTPDGRHAAAENGEAVGSEYHNCRKKISTRNAIEIKRHHDLLKFVSFFWHFDDAPAAENGFLPRREIVIKHAILKAHSENRNARHQYLASTND